MNGLEILNQIYVTRGFIITSYHGDNEFDMQALKIVLPPGILFICARDEQVNIIERYNQYIK